MERDKESMSTFNFKSFIINTLRRASYRWPERNKALQHARIERGLYACNQCKGTFKKKDIKLDHINPVVAVTGFTTWDDYINRLFCDYTNFQVVCENCHNVKTMIEKQERKIHKNMLTSEDKPDTVYKRKKKNVK